MKPLANKLKLQKGDFLIESLVGLLLMSIVGLGITHIAGRVSVVQSKTSENAVVFDQLRATLTSNTGPSASLAYVLPLVWIWTLFRGLILSKQRLRKGAAL